MPGKCRSSATSRGRRRYDTDWNNFAPSVGVAWTPSAGAGAGWRDAGQTRATRHPRRLLASLQPQGHGDFTGVFGANPGVAIDVSRNRASATSGRAGALFRRSARLNRPPFPPTPAYPMTDVVTQDVNMFDPDLQVPYAAVLDGRLAARARPRHGDRSPLRRHAHPRQWSTYNYNEMNIIENGFLDEFKLGAGRTCRRTSPRPGAANGSFAIAGRAPARRRCRSTWRTSTAQPRRRRQPGDLHGRRTGPTTRSVNPLARSTRTRSRPANALDGRRQRAHERDPGRAAGELLRGQPGPARRRQRPNGGTTTYHSWPLRVPPPAVGRAAVPDQLRLRQGRDVVRSPRVPRPISFMVARLATGRGHARRSRALVYELPFGQGNRFGSDVNGFVDRLHRRVEVDVARRASRADSSSISATSRVVGMSQGRRRQRLFKLRMIDGDKKVWMLPQDVIDNTIKAFSVSATANLNAPNASLTNGAVAH